MARKQAVLKIKDGIDKDWQKQLDNLNRMNPVEGTEESYKRFVTACAVRFKQQYRFDQACDFHDLYGSDETRALMKHEGVQLERALHAELGALDMWRYQCKHLNDKVTVPEDEIRSIVTNTLSDKLDELRFKVNYGILGTKVAQAIRNDVAEDDTLEAAFCKEHAA